MINYVRFLQHHFTSTKDYLSADINVINNNKQHNITSCTTKRPLKLFKTV